MPQKKLQKLLSMSVLLGISFYTSETVAKWCVPDSSSPEAGLNVIEYGIGNIAYAGQAELFGRDGNNGIYVLIKSPNGTRKAYPIDNSMNLNDPHGATIVSTLKSALLTGARVKLNSDDNCNYINAVAIMIPN